mmetsp:Transcript_30053/g.47122  ORF Transcript_30053/g.47122 Transcript_30053/m.47122 type:complete len:279 (+) Transcript_30053:3-839(+)
MASSSYEAVAAFAPPSLAASRRSWYMKSAIAACIGAAAVVCIALLAKEKVAETQVHDNALGGAYYAVTKPPAFNFNRFIQNAWFYDGRSADLNEEDFIEKLARRHHYKLQIHHLNTFKDNEFRAALFSENIHCIVFPPLLHFPGVSELAKKDLRGYVSAGNNVVFIGSYEWLSVMNDVFGFQLMSDYKDGPYYRNDRTVRGTPFQWSMSRLSQPDGSVYGVKVDSIPMDGSCMFDTMGCCVVFYVKYNLGTIVYIAFDYDTPYGIGHWDQILHAGMMM